MTFCFAVTIDLINLIDIEQNMENERLKII